MNHFSLLLFILIINLSKEKEEKEDKVKGEEEVFCKDFPPNSYFDLKIDYIDKNKTKIYNGSQLAYFEIDYNPECLNPNITFDLASKNAIIYCQNAQKYIKNVNNESLISYGEIIFIRYEILSYYILFVGFFITFYGSSHYIFGIFTHISLFLYFLIKDLVELFGRFNEFIPLFLITFSFITGLAFVTFNYFSESDMKLKNKIIKTLYGCIFGYFLFKTIFYNIVIFSLVNIIVYSIFLFIFIIIGFCFGFFINYLDKLDKVFYIPCSILPGSFYIVKGIAYIVGGYYSDIITIRKGLEFKRENNFLYDDNCKKKVLLYMFIQCFLIICAFLYQLFYNNYINIDLSESTTGSTKSTSRSSLLASDISKVKTKEVDETKYGNENNNITAINISGNEDDESNDICDQED